MRIERIGTFSLRIILSERNLRVLLSKLTMPDSARTIATIADDGTNVFISSEPDDQHYANRLPPGPMHPETEADLRKG